jgi:hypothetical protein
MRGAGKNGERERHDQRSSGHASVLPCESCRLE